MKARKLDLKPYDFEIGGKVLPYDVKLSCISTLMHRDQKLDARELLKREILARKIEEAGDSILLDSSEWEKLKASAENIRGYTRQDVELVERIMGAEEVDVKEQE